jgi:uncharacterized caspase-like protein
MTRRLALGSLVLLAFLFWQEVSIAQPSSRVALVIGNGAYREGIASLANPPNDARALALVLERLGFHVDLLIDGDRAAMLAAIRRLGETAKNADAALLFFAGHAAEVGGRNILFPTSVSARGTDHDLSRTAIPYDEISSALSGKAKSTLIILDACRNNPFTVALAPSSEAGRQETSSRTPTRSIGTGLASVASTSATLIAFATAPGQVASDGSGKNSPFTAALLQHIGTPDIEIRDMLTRVRRTVRQSTAGSQVPWDNSSLEAPFFFRTGGSAGISPGPTSRIIDEATAQGIPLPENVRELRFQRLSTGSPADLLVGSWSSGHRRWSGRSGRKNVLIVLSVNVSQGTADTIFAQSEYAEDGVERSERTLPVGGDYYQRRVMALKSGSSQLDWTFPTGENIQFKLVSSDTMLGLWRREGTGERKRTQEARVQMYRID